MHDGMRWLDLEVARRALVARDPARAHNSALFRQPITTLDAHLVARPARRRPGRPAGGRGRRADGRIGPGLRAAGPGAADVPRLLRLRAARRHDVEATRHGDPRGVVPPADLLLQQHVGDARPRRPGVGATGERRAGLRAGGRRADRHAGARRGRRARHRCDRWLHDPQRLERSRPAARGDDRPARPGEGQGLRVLDRSVARHAGRACRRASAERATTWR